MFILKLFIVIVLIAYICFSIWITVQFILIWIDVKELQKIRKEITRLNSELK